MCGWEGVVARGGRSGSLVVSVAAAALITALVVASPGPGAADGNEAPGNPAAFRSISVGYNSACASVDWGNVKCWGWNYHGGLGLGDTADRGDEPGEMGNDLPAVNLGSGRTATALSIGVFGGCAVLDTGSVKCWGDNQYGQLGLGDTANRGDQPGEMGDNLPAVNLGTGRTATAISMHGGGTCALLDNGRVKCWGWNAYGQLGLGDTANRGDQPGEMGDNLPAGNLGTGRTATAITSAGGHACALLDDGTVKCWGWNYYGGLGLGDTASRGDGPNEMGDDLPVVDLGADRTVTALTAGTNGHSCALLDNRTVKCWGWNNYGQLGVGDNAIRGDQPGEMGYDLPTVELGSGRTATAITAGQNHTCALLDNNTVKCWGIGLWIGQGGSGGAQTPNNLPPVDLGSGRTALAVSAGTSHTCALLDDHSLKCWGYNGYGQLGVDDTDNRGDEPGEMGDSLPAVDLGSVGVWGTVTDSISGAPVPGAWVAALRTTDFTIAGGGIADASGLYSVLVPPGSYYLYLVDPTGGHTPGFHGPPATVMVTDGQVNEADPAMAPTRGSITGTVVEDGTANPVAGAWAIAINAFTGAPETGAAADGSGRYTLPDLIAQDHLMVYVDPAGRHTSEFYANSPDAAHANPIAVTAGGSAVANDSMAAQPLTPSRAALTGTVTETDTNTPLAGVMVMALRSADYRLARGTVTDTSGNYTLEVDADTYKVVFLDPTSDHDMEWNDNQPYYRLADATSVTAPAVTNAALDPNRGSIAGTITDDQSGEPVAGAWVLAIGPTGPAGGAVTGTDGTYTLPGLPTGNYKAAIIDPSGGHTFEYWNNRADYPTATLFAVAASDTTTINAAIAPPPVETSRP